MPIDILDTNHDTSKRLVRIKDAGFKTIIRYINPLGTKSEKTIKQAEAHAIANAGLSLGLVCEGWGDFAHNAISAAAGARDGAFCAKYATLVGAPKGAAIYYAVDVDASNSQIRSRVLPYFANIGKADGEDYKVGVYGCGAVCKAVLDAGLAQYAWLTNASGWNGSHEFRDSKRWCILQHLPKEIAGIDTDPDEGNPEIPDMGVFTPFGNLTYADAQGLPPAIPSPSGYTEDGEASWYDDPQEMANGEQFDPEKYTAAHKTLPFGTMVRVTRPDNGLSVAVEITDRGPYYKNRIIDLSRAAARAIDMIDVGVAQVHIQATSK